MYFSWGKLYCFLLIFFESETYSFSTKTREVENALKISRCKWKRFFSANCWNAEEVDQDNSLFTYWAASLLENPCKCF